MAQMYINGEWVEAISGRTDEVRNPANGQRVGAVPQGDERDVEAAVEAAVAAFPKWAEAPAEERAAILFRGLAGLKEAQGEIARLLTQEQGKPLLTRRDVRQA